MMAGPGRVLLVDDDAVFRGLLARSLEARGYVTVQAGDGVGALRQASELTLTHAVVDLKMPGETGLALIRRLLEFHPGLRVIMLTGYASIATAVEAIQAGAMNYLAKPATADEIAAALGTADALPAAPRSSSAPPPAPMSVRRLEWEHIQRVLAEHGGNIAATARALNMHRRTLQRKLGKRPAPR
jgi:two-component system response regulator RegA